MKKIVLLFMTACILGIQAIPVFAADRFGSAITDSTTSIANNLERPISGINGPDGVRDLIIYIVKKIVTPILIIVSILIGILGFYDLLTSSKDDDQKKGYNYIIRGVVGIVVMISANFLADTLVNGGIFAYQNGELVGTLSAQRIYQRLMFPFLKFAMFLVMGVLFILALFRTISMLLSPKEDAAKAARHIIQRNAIGILVIIFAKSMIESVFGTEAQVVSTTATNLGQVGTGAFAVKQLPFVYTVVNYVMGLIGIAILVIIIIQAVQLLTNPTDDSVQKKMRKNFIYILIGLILIGTAYVVTNVFIVK